MAPIRITDPTTQLRYKGSYRFPVTLPNFGGTFNRRRGFTIDQETGHVFISLSAGAAYTCTVGEFIPPTPVIPTDAQRNARDRNAIPQATLVGSPTELVSGNPNIFQSTLAPELFTEGFAIAKKSDLGLIGDDKIFVHSARYNYNVDGATADRPSISLFDYPWRSPIGGGGPFKLSGHHVNGLGMTTYVHLTDARLGGKRLLTGSWYAQGSSNSSPHPATAIGWTPPQPFPAAGSSIADVITLCKDTFPISYPALPGQLVSYIPGQGLVDPFTNDSRFMGAAVYDVPADANSVGTRGYVRAGRAGSAQLYCTPSLNGTGATHDCLRPELANGTTPPGGYCYTTTGYHNDPFTPMLMFFDLDDFDLVRRGIIAQNAPRHHAAYFPDKIQGSNPIVWWPGTCHQDSMGMAYHYARNELHWSQQAAYADSGSTYPVVHVFEFLNATGGGGGDPPPSTPTPKSHRVRHKRRRAT